MKTLNKLDKYFITPNTNFYGGFKYDGEDIFLCDDTDTEEERGYVFHVVQKIENNILITDLERKYTIYGNKVNEKSHMEINIKEGQILVYVEGQGYVIPEYRMKTLEEVVGIYEVMRGGNNNDNITRNEEKDT